MGRKRSRQAPTEVSYPPTQPPHPLPPMLFAAANAAAASTAAAASAVCGGLCAHPSAHTHTRLSPTKRHPLHSVPLGSFARHQRPLHQPLRRWRPREQPRPPPRRLACQLLRAAQPTGRFHRAPPPPAITPVAVFPSEPHQQNTRVVSSTQGGGTRFYALHAEGEDGLVVQPTRAGDLVLHSGQLRHEGVATTEGERWMLIGFINCAGGFDQQATALPFCSGAPDPPHTHTHTRARPTHAPHPRTCPRYIPHLALHKLKSVGTKPGNIRPAFVDSMRAQ